MNKQPALKRLQVLYSALLMGQALFFVAVILLRNQGTISFDMSNGTDRILQVIAVVFAFAASYIGIKIYHRKTATLREGNFTPEEKMKQYTQASIVRWALGEAAVLFTLIGYLLTGNWAFTGLTIILLFLFAGYYPSKPKIVKDLDLTEQDITSLQ